MKGSRTMEKVEKTEKKAYSRPAIVRVKLNPEQAVLGTCAASGSSLSQGGAGRACVVGGSPQSKTVPGAHTRSSPHVDGKVQETSPPQPSPHLFPRTSLPRRAAPT